VLGNEIGRIEVILTGNVNKREQRIPPGIGQRGTHAMRGRGLADRADRPIRGNPLNSAQEFEPLMSTIRTASIRGLCEVLTCSATNLICAIGARI
jgi:hypothetical protein